MSKNEQVFEAGNFWAAPEADIFPLPAVAAALGVGRNRMCDIPVKRLKISGQWCYQKSAILDWAETDDGAKLLRELVEKKKADKQKKVWMKSPPPQPVNEKHEQAYEAIFMK